MKWVMALYCLLWITCAWAQETDNELRRIQAENHQQLLPTEEEQVASSVIFQSSQQYFQTLDTHEIVSRHEGVRAVMMLLNRYEKYPKISDQWQYLTDLHILPPTITFDQGQEPLTRGVLAYVLCQLLNERQSLMIKLFGVRQRFAYRHMVALGIMPSGGEQVMMTGRELWQVLSRAQRYAKD